jgi:inosine/xanthosine triphosphatase
MIIAVGSTNPVKLAAVSQITLAVWPTAQVRAIDSPSGVRAMPMSDEECLQGARRRALDALDRGEADLGIGLEGGVHRERSGLMLMGWVVAIDRGGREGVASTARLPLPGRIARRVLSGEELGMVMDDVLNDHNTRQKGGAVGALTGGLVQRQDAFAMAVAYALAPFVTPDLYLRQP